jgi:hypothetical protein
MSPLALLSDPSRIVKGLSHVAGDFRSDAADRQLEDRMEEREEGRESNLPVPRPSAQRGDTTA